MDKVPAMIRNALVPVSLLVQFFAYLLTFLVFALAGDDYYTGPPTLAQFGETIRAYPLVVGTSLVPPILLGTALLFGWWLFSIFRAKKGQGNGWVIVACISAAGLGTFWGTWFQLLMSGV